LTNLRKRRNGDVERPASFRAGSYSLDKGVLYPAGEDEMPIPIPPDLPLEVHIPDGMPITFANYTFVQTVGGDFIVSFFQAVHPMVPPNESGNIKTLPATCVARLAMSRSVAEAMFLILADFFECDVKKKGG